MRTDGGPGFSSLDCLRKRRVRTSDVGLIVMKRQLVD
jgi:hypothetical protein